ncbi:AraC family transcriptional regulator [Niveibacterium sp. 24ML]|uniref:AraC family transcriptional regulator n=1 Tax=Niveibacterium sp. 24ML TaxID=2985512 RepID=UPI002270B00F|nr:AraC family transcriptional regulator [Niveibacterium sp. 24ML]MCX9155610.1 AraC family transcriptional regulator [Niveibacterium sp. 24ML]
MPAQSSATVAPAFVRGMLAGAHAAGFDAAALLAQVEIDAACLVRDEVRVPLAHYAALYNHVAATLDDEAFGLFPQPMRVGSFEFLCRGVLSAATLGEALARAVRFLRLVLPDVSITVARSGEQAQLTISERQPFAVDRVFSFEWLLRLLHGLSCWLVGRGIALDAVDFPYPPPAHVADYTLIYTAHSRFAAPVDSPATPLVAHFAANLLDLPLRRDEAALARFLAGGPGRLTTLYRRDREMVTRVRDLLREALPELPTLETVAARLHLSPRTLARRLEAEASSFRAIREALRRDLALARLGQTDVPVATLAAELGYAEPSAFFRAFVGWTGQSPSAWRRGRRAG